MSSGGGTRPLLKRSCLLLPVTMFHWNMILKPFYENAGFQTQQDLFHWLTPFRASGHIWTTAEPWEIKGTCINYCYNWLVVSIPLKNISQLGWSFPIYGKTKNVPNHQPELVAWIHASCLGTSPNHTLQLRVSEEIGSMVDSGGYRGPLIRNVATLWLFTNWTPS